MKQTESKTPNYAIGETYAWDAALHQEIENYLVLGWEMTNEERARFIDDWCRAHKATVDSIVLCPHCKKEIGDNEKSQSQREFEKQIRRELFSRHGIRVEDNGGAGLRKRSGRLARM